MFFSSDTNVSRVTDIGISVFLVTDTIVTSNDAKLIGREITSLDGITSNASALKLPFEPCN